MLNMETIFALFNIFFLLLLYLGYIIPLNPVKSRPAKEINCFLKRNNILVDSYIIILYNPTFQIRVMNMRNLVAKNSRHRAVVMPDKKKDYCRRVKHAGKKYER